MKIKNSFRGGRVNIPSSKSYHHRYLIANALSILQNKLMEANEHLAQEQNNRNYIEIKSIGICDDVLATIEAIKNLGIEVEIEKKQDFPPEKREGAFDLEHKEANSINIIRLATKLPFVKRESRTSEGYQSIQNQINSNVLMHLNTNSRKNQISQNSDSFLVFNKLPNGEFSNRLLNYIEFNSFLNPLSTTYHINVKESGSTLRFLIPICIALNIDVWIDGKGTLVKRPLTDYIHLFDEKKINYCYDGKLPIHLKPDQANQLTGELKVSTEISSQFLSGLLFACPLLHQDSCICVDSNLKSEDYINMTLDVLNQCGITVEKENSDRGKIFKIKKNQSYQSKDVFVEGDYSCAAFLIAAGILSKEVQIGNLNPHSLQGDRKLISLLQSAGADIQFVDDLLSIRPSDLNAIEIDAQGIIDSVPILCVLFSTAKGRTKIYNVKRLKAKESDRIKSSIDMISSLGGKAYYQEEEDCIIIDGVKQLKGGFVHSFSDHRIAMSASIAALVCQNEVEIDDYQCVSKSYTDFFHDFKKLGGEYVI